MGKINVHVQMKECCRNKLEELDAQKQQAGIKGPALAPLGEMPADKAKNKIPSLKGGSSAAEKTARQICAKLCEAHAKEHDGKGEKREGAFWHDLAGAFQGKELDPKAQQLKDTSVAAARNNRYACNQSTAAVADAYGHNELDGKDANGQVAYMNDNWKTVSAQEAQERANRGELVVAGLANDGGHGHVAVVTPGSGAVAPDENFYPQVTGGAMNQQYGYSEGEKTAGQVWSRSDRGNVQYYVP